MKLRLEGWNGREIEFSDEGTLMGKNSLYINGHGQISLEDSRKLLKWLIEREIRIAKDE